MKYIVNYISAVLILFTFLNTQNKKDIEASWATASKRLDDTWFAHEKKIDGQFKKLEKRIRLIWDRIEKSTQFEYVSYSDDAKSKTQVGFKSGIIKIEVIEDASRENFKKQDMKEQLAKRLSEIYRAKDGNNVQFLKGQIVKQNVLQGEKNTKRTEYMAKDGRKKVKYSRFIKLGKGHLSKRAKQYLPLAQKYGKKYNVPVDLIMAIMETESEFNPYADNGLAKGLMQLVPKSGAYEAARTVFGKRMLIPDYKLKKPEINISLGVALLYQYMYWKAYLKPYQKHTYKHELMAQAGYNCGGPRMSRWIRRNPGYMRLSNPAFFKKLYNYVPKETKGYVKKVPKRRLKYK